MQALITKKTFFALFSVFAVLAVYVVFYFVFRIPFTSFSPETADFSYPLAVLDHAYGDSGEKGVLLFRVREQQGAFVSGDWRISMSSPETVYLYRGPEVKRIHGDSVHNAKFKDLKGDILDVRENATGSHIFIQSVYNGKTHFCLVPVFSTSAETLLCEGKIFVAGTNTMATWNPADSRQIIILSTLPDKQLLYTSSLDDIRMNMIPSDQSSETYDGFVANFAEPKVLAPYVFHFLHLWLVKSASGFRVMSLPMSARLTWFVPEKVLLMKTRDRISLIFPEDDFGADILEALDLHESTVRYFSEGRMHQL